VVFQKITKMATISYDAKIKSKSLASFEEEKEEE